MKRWSTTPVSKGLVTKSALVATAVVMVMAGPLGMMPKAGAESIDQLNAKIEALKNEEGQYRKEAEKLQKKEQTLEGKISGLQNQQRILQGKIDINQAAYDKLTQQVVETEKQIKDNQDALGVTLADLYVDDTISPLEMLASSKNIGDYVDKQTYRSAMSDQLHDTIRKIDDLKKELVKQRTGVKVALTNQENAKVELVKSKNEQQQLLNETNGKESAYQGLIKKNQTEQDELADKAQQQMIANAGTLITSGASASGGYPWNPGNCPMQGWVSYGGVGGGQDGYGYGCRQCASYAAWRANKETGRYPTGWGDAADFPWHAEQAGFSQGSTPRAGSIAVMSPAQAGNPHGHVAWVDAVNSDGSITVSQYNYWVGAWGMYSQMQMNASDFYTYIYFK